MNEDIFNFIEKIASRHRTRKLKDNKEIVDFLNEKYPGVLFNIQIYSFMNNISPFCSACGKPVKTLAKQTCSVECRESLKSSDNTYFSTRYEKAKITSLERYGVTNANKNAEIQNKRISTLIEKYGAKVSPLTLQSTKDRAPDLNKKGRETLLKNYGVTNPGQLQGHYDKVKATMIKNFGVEHYSQTIEFKNIKEKIRIKKYDLFSPQSITILGTHSADEKKEIFEKPNRIIEFLCSDCNTNDSIPSETFKWRIKNTGTPCLKCSGIKSGSLKEQEIRQYVESLGIKIQSNIRILDGLEIDIFLPEMNIGIEFHGLFWHNDTRLDKNYHRNKLDIAKKKGIRLIQIFEDEWENKKDIVKSRLLNIFKLNNNKIYGRSCVIKEISYKQEYAFLEENHIQGYARSSIKIGLFFNNKLVSLMTFSRPNLSKGIRGANEKEWELLRFCSSKHTNVIGSAGKLFSYFIHKYNPDNIISFSDNRWSIGDLYKILCFSNSGDTPLNYWYIDLKGVKRIHRFSMRKNSQDDQSLTEYENRLKQGYLRIWDCGNTRWIWNKSNNVRPT